MAPPAHSAASLWPPGHPRHNENYAEEYEYDSYEDEKDGPDPAQDEGGVRARPNGRFSELDEGYRHDGSSDGGFSGDGELQSERELFESELEPLTLPESTHTLFFTQPVCSLPFLYALSIVAISLACLLLAVLNNLLESSADNQLNVPANVSKDVRAAQYLAIFVALLMEEEIPTGVHLLRMVSRESFHSRFPSKSYCKYVMAALLRIAMGYIFLGNVFIILAQASGVIEIFYDVLALQFIQQLDDISFAVAKLDVLGKGLHRACTARLFQTEFEKRKFGRRRKSSAFLKWVYSVNLGLILFGMIWISLKQEQGQYQCDEIQVDFGDDVWEDALVETPSGKLEKRILVFSTFNGAYIKHDTVAGRPRYRERRKMDRELFETVEPAEIFYNETMEAWVFSHPNIRKSEYEESRWLLKSPKTTEFDLLNVDGDWNLWRGRLSKSTVTTECMNCEFHTDCNLNGLCVNDLCECYPDKETGLKKFVGPHCEVKLTDECGTIKSEEGNFTFSLFYYAWEEDQPANILFEQYNRPVYALVEAPNFTQEEINWLVYTGRRWIFIGFNPVLSNMTMDDVLVETVNFHGFWNSDFSFSSPGLTFISDPTMSDTPVGVDWYQIGERGSQFGPFGALYPLQKDGQKGRGIFRCAGPVWEWEDPANSTIPTNSTNTTSV